VSFKKYLTEEIMVKVPRPHDKQIAFNVHQYQEIVSNSLISSGRKLINMRLSEGKGEVPIFCEELKKFYMFDLQDPKKAREIKSREDKELCGAFFNGLIVTENLKSNTEKVAAYKQMPLNWDVPSNIYRENR
jgi:hypothetical protein